MKSLANSPGRTQLRSMMFDVGDCLFLTLTGTLAVAAMGLVNELGWGFAVTCIAGMASAMAVQMLLAFCVSPILGSIETMTPSMVVAMASSMSQCALRLSGFELSWPGSCGIGAAIGAGMFVFVVVYGDVCKRALRRVSPGL